MNTPQAARAQVGQGPIAIGDGAIGELNPPHDFPHIPLRKRDEAVPYGAAPHVARSAIGARSSTPIIPTLLTHHDLAALFGRRDIIRAVRQWRSENGFPAPLPWSRRPLRWDAKAVQRWKDNAERDAGCLVQPEGR
jgi:hypothetical protein